MGIFSKLFGQKTTVPFPDIPITVDMHSHLLPGIDDGAQDLNESLDLIRGMQALGYRKLVTTPHVMGDFYKNDPATIKDALGCLQKAVQEEGLDVELEAAGEYYLDEWFADKLENGDLLTFGDGYLLVETSFMNRPAQLLETFFQMGVKGYKPVFAHPERYIYLYEDFQKYEEIYEKGVYFQINLNSLQGYYSPEARKAAEKLIDKGMVDFVGSDVHRMKHVNMLQQVCSNKSFNKLKEMKLLNETLLTPRVENK